MIVKLTLASIYTLGLLFGFLAAIIFSVAYIFGVINLFWFLGLTVVVTFFIWLVGPYIIDLTHRIFYRIDFFSRREFQQMYPELYRFIKKITVRYNLPFPKMRIIYDDNPTAYTYGSAAFNARIVLTRGLFIYLQPEEIQAVIAHEIGHIVHRDFIVMTIANTIIQLLYEIYQVFLKNQPRYKNGKNKKKYWNPLFIVGIAAFIFYHIGFYITLFLSRIREYYADEFSARITGKPHALSTALIKVAYGIIAEKKISQSTRLITSTRALGIMGFRTAKGIGLIAKATNLDPHKIAKVLLYDLISPWAKFTELGSTHPLTVKRLVRLDWLTERMGGQAIFNMPKIFQENSVNRQRLWKEFFFGIFMCYLPFIIPVIAVLILSFFIAPKTIFNTLKYLAILFGLFGFGLILQAFYYYPSFSNVQNTDVLSLMSDPYATPVKGKPIMLQGTIIGRGMPGYVLSEDMMLQDGTGLMYLDYYPGIPVIGYLIFLWKKIRGLFGRTMSMRGWFFRSNFQYVVLDSLWSSHLFIRSYTKFWHIAIGLFFIIIAVIVIII